MRINDKINGHDFLSFGLGKVLSLYKYIKYDNAIIEACCRRERERGCQLKLQPAAIFMELYGVLCRTNELIFSNKIDFFCIQPDRTHNVVFKLFHSIFLHSGMVCIDF